MLPYARPSLSDDEIREVEECLRSGWLATGPRTARFEEELARFCGTRHAVATNSGTAALHLAVLAAGIEPGDEVVTTPMTWVATANVLVHAGAVPVFADVEEGTLNIDPGQVAAAITPRTKAILPVHYAGQVCAMDELLGLAREHDLRVIEDAAHAIGARHGDREVGSIGDATMFSFHPAKNLTTGEGGALVTDSASIAEKARRLRYHGIDAGESGRNSGRGPGVYDLIDAGFKYNMSDLQASIGLHQLADLRQRNERRRALAQRYREGLAGLDHVSPLDLKVALADHAWHMLVVRLEVEELTADRDELIAELRDAGVGAGVHFVPLHLLSYYRDARGSDGLPVATDAHRRIMTLPLFPDMTDADVDFVLEHLAALLERFARPVPRVAAEGKR